jgi:hypothetical protein
LAPRITFVRRLLQAEHRFGERQRRLCSVLRAWRGRAGHRKGGKTLKSGHRRVEMPR